MTNFERLIESPETLVEFIMGDYGDSRQYEEVLCFNTEHSFPIRWDEAQDSLVDTILEWLKKDCE